MIPRPLLGLGMIAAAALASCGGEQNGVVSAVYNGQFSGSITLRPATCDGDFYADVVCRYSMPPDSAAIGFSFVADYFAVPVGTSLRSGADFGITAIGFESFTAQPGLSYYNSVDPGTGSLAVHIDDHDQTAGTTGVTISGSAQQPSIVVTFSDVKARLP